MKKLLFIFILFFYSNIFCQNELYFKILGSDALPITNCELWIDNQLKMKVLPDGKCFFNYDNETRQYKFSLYNPETGIKKKFLLNTTNGKNDFPTTFLVFNQLSVFIRLEDENYDIKSVFDALDSCGATDLFVETFYNDRTIYPSSVKGVGQHGKKDYLREILDEAREHGIRVHASINTLFWHDNKSKEKNLIPAGALSVNRQGKGNEGEEKDLLFVSPNHPEVVRILSGVIEELIKKYPELFGINFNYIRFKSGIADDKNLKTNDYGYEKSTTDDFQKTYNLDPRTFTLDTSLQSNWMKWIEYKENQIASLIIKLVSKVKTKSNEFNLTACVSPDYINQRGHNLECQNWADFVNICKVDYLLQMCSDNTRYPQQIESVQNYLESSVILLSQPSNVSHDPLYKQIEVLRNDNLLNEFGILQFSSLKDKENQKLLRNLMFRNPE
jgi:hypothetical protein